MTQLLQQALAEVQKLPQADQDAIAAIILDELADERRWDEAFANSQDKLERLADKALDDIRAGLVLDIGISACCNNCSRTAHPRRHNEDEEKKD